MLFEMIFFFGVGLDVKKSNRIVDELINQGIKYQDSQKKKTIIAQICTEINP